VPSAFEAMNSPLFCHGFLNDSGLEPLFSKHLFEVSIFYFRLLQAGHHGRIHPTKARALFVEASAAHPMLVAQLRDRRSSLSLLKNGHDLDIGKT